MHGELKIEVREATITPAPLVSWSATQRKLFPHLDTQLSGLRAPAQRCNVYSMAGLRKTSESRLEVVSRASERAQWAKALVNKPDNLSSIPEIHIKEDGENQLHSVIL